MGDILEMAADGGSCVDNPTYVNKELEVDSDEVVSERQKTVVIAAKVLSTPGAAIGTVAIGMFYSLGMMNRVFDQDENEHNWAIYNLGKTLFAVAAATVPCAVLSARRAMCEGGTMDTLGAGVTLISAEDAKSMKRWGNVAMFASLVAIWVGLKRLIPDSEADRLEHQEWCEEQRRRGDRNACIVPTEYSLYIVVVGPWFDYFREGMRMLYCIVVLPLLFSWYLTLKECSILVSDAVLEARKKIGAVSAHADEWDTEVVPQVLELITDILPALSAGFGWGIFTLFVACWVGALGMVCIALKVGDPTPLVFALGFVTVPMLLSLDVAGASSDCDKVKVQLNTKRLESMDLETDAKLQVLERALTNVNRGQGLGFVVAGKVLDRKTLYTIVVAVGGLLGTIFPLMLALRTPDHVGGDTPCSLSAQQLAGIQAAMFSRNETCSFNSTIDEVLAMASGG